MVTVKKEALIDLICQDTGRSRYEVRGILDSIIANIALLLSKGRRVSIGDFGSFSPQRRAARIGRNPHTGEAVPIPERTIARFVPGKLMKQSASDLEAKERKK